MHPAAPALITWLCKITVSAAGEWEISGEAALAEFMAGCGIRPDDAAEGGTASEPDMPREHRTVCWVRYRSFVRP